MYEHIRANLAKDLDAARGRVDQAIAHRDQVAAALGQQQAALPGLQAAVTAAEGTLAARDADLAAAQAVVNQRTAERNAAEDERDSAQEAFDANGGDEPPFFDNPEDLRRWHVVHDQLQQALRDARDALDAAQGHLQDAIDARAPFAAAVQAAAASLAQARDRVTAQNATIAATQRQLADAEAAITAARADVDAIAAQVTALDQREKVLTAEPLDRPTIEKAADQEEADLQAGWHHRRELFERRVTFRDGRAGVLAAADTTVDELAVVRSQIAAWPDAARFPALAGVVAQLDQVIADNAAQRHRPPAERTDDLAGLHTRLAALTTTLQDVTGAATAARDQAQHDLDKARDDLVAHQQEAPR